ncbi:MAG: HAD hydrolase family protein [Candidatus Lokiarchaeota archaeon]|nr:HAD hydrolase family protein [Candidatus Lokiarchaeota archaeon]
MKLYNIPNYGKFEIHNILLDLNGTITAFGNIPADLRYLIQEMKKHFEIYVISANTRDTLDEIAEELDIKAIHIPKSKAESQSKLTSLRVLDPDQTIVIGNGNNDTEIITQAAIGISVIGKEGTSIQALISSDMVVQSLSDAFKILLDEKALIATLRK